MTAFIATQIAFIAVSLYLYIEAEYPVLLYISGFCSGTLLTGLLLYSTK